MGGLSFVLYNNRNPVVNINFTKSFMNMSHRGPDDTNYRMETTIPLTRMNEEQIKMNLSRREFAEYTPYTFMYGYHRLSINDTSKDGAQPFDDPILHKVRKYPDLKNRIKRTLMCNGEIYNYNELIQQEQFTDKDLQSSSDVEVILPMYIKYGLDETLKRLNGDYSFILTENLNTYDLKTLNIYVVRDILGIKPLYMLKSKRDIFYMFVSELKGIPDFILEDKDQYIIQEVPPGTMWSFNNSIINRSSEEFIRYSDWNYYKSLDHCIYNSTDATTLSKLYTNIRSTIENATKLRVLSSSVPVGILLSGGFDSNIIMSIMAQLSISTGSQLHAFTIGEKTNDDVIKASACVDYLEKKFGIEIYHHIVTISSMNLTLQNIDNIVYSLETYDPKVIRSALPYVYLFKYIKENTNVKVLLTGEGLDELCGYTPFFTLNDEDFQKKSVKLIKNLSKYDLLRADKISSLYGLELRHPFLDKHVLELILSIHPRLKRPQIYDITKPPIEKYIIRKAFDSETYLTSDTLWNPIKDIETSLDYKDFTLNNTITKYYNNFYSDIEYYQFIVNCTTNQPRNKEEMHYRKIFNKIFKNHNILPRFWDQLWE